MVTRKVFFLFLFFILVPLCVSAVHRPVVHYALPKGYPFISDTVDAARDYHIVLRFGIRLSIKKIIENGHIEWYRCSWQGREFYLPDTYVVKNSQPEAFDCNGNLIIGEEVVDRDNGIPLSYIPNDLIKIPIYYHAKGYEWRTMQLRKAAAGAFERLIEDAEKEAITIRMISAFRNAQYQSNLYQRALKKNGMYQLSVAKPGHSEHQLGTACDLTSSEIGYSLSPDFEHTKAYRWLIAHSPSYGIYLTYPRYKQRITTYIYEPWHFRYWGVKRWEKAFERYNLTLTR